MINNADITPPEREKATKHREERAWYNSQILYCPKGKRKPNIQKKRTCYNADSVVKGGKSMNQIQELEKHMIAYYSGDPKRIQHFIKVYQLAELIGSNEQMTAEELHILKAAALVHDIGIKPAEEKYNDCNGKLQEQEGPAEAEKMMKEIGFSQTEIARVSYLVGHHHTYSDIDGLDYQILVEADFLVNLYEDGVDEKAIRNAYEKIFVTETGKWILRKMFGM